jgi:hypothetical protein
LAFQTQDILHVIESRFLIHYPAGGPNSATCEIVAAVGAMYELEPFSGGDKQHVVFADDITARMV